jgi:hypothetical protein
MRWAQPFPRTGCTLGCPSSIAHHRYTRLVFTRIDASYLSRPHAPAGDGLIATFHADGQLRTLAVYRGGARISPELTLEHATMAARLTHVPEPDQTADWEVYRPDGTCEKFDPWSDNSRPYATPWEPWVTRWIREIERYAPHPSG